MAIISNNIYILDNFSGPSSSGVCTHIEMHKPSRNQKIDILKSNSSFADQLKCWETLHCQIINVNSLQQLISEKIYILHLMTFKYLL